MAIERRDKIRVRKLAAALDCNYTKALRIYQAEAFNYELDWDAVDDEFLRTLFGGFV